MINLKLSPEESLVLLCCCTDSSESRIEKIRTIVSLELNWDYILKITCVHGISGLVFKNTKHFHNKNVIPNNFTEKLEKEYHKTAYKNSLLTQAYNNILKEFNSEKIKTMPLKGITLLSQLYHNIGLRSISDIDILVEKKDLHCAEQILMGMGYAKKKESASKIKRHFHSIYWKKIGPVTIPVELHWDIDFLDSPFSIRIEDFWHRAELLHNNNQTYYKLSLEDCLIFNSFHILRDGLKTLYLKNFCDLSEIIKKSGTEINWGELACRSKEYKVERPVFLVLLLLKKLLQIYIPLHFFHNIKIVEKEEEKIFFVIVSENIFLKKRDNIYFPKGLLDLTSEKHLTGKYRVVLGMFKNFCLEFKQQYYSDFNHSVLKGAQRSSVRHFRTLKRYIKIFIFSRFNTQKANNLRYRKVKKQAGIEEINKWIREDS